jgi:GC-rich sequence DNA-binding factor
VASLADERAQLDAQEAELRGLITKAEEKRSWFAAFTEWVESVATFLDEKVCK